MAAAARATQQAWDQGVPPKARAGGHDAGENTSAVKKLVASAMKRTKDKIQNVKGCFLTADLDLVYECLTNEMEFEHIAQHSEQTLPTVETKQRKQQHLVAWRTCLPPGDTWRHRTPKCLKVRTRRESFPSKDFSGAVSPDPISPPITVTSTEAGASNAGFPSGVARAQVCNSTSRHLCQRHSKSMMQRRVIVLRVGRRRHNMERKWSSSGSFQKERAQALMRATSFACLAI